MATHHEDRADRIEREIAAALPEGIAADCALAAVLTHVTRRMSGGEARRIIDAMPERHRAVLSRLLADRGEEALAVDRSAIVGAIAQDLGGRADGERIAHAVLAAIGHELPQGLLRRALAQLPPDVASLWRTDVEGPIAGPVTSAPRTFTSESVPPDTTVDHPLLRRLDAMRAVPPGFTSASTFSVVGCALARRLTRGEAERLIDALPSALAPLLAPCTVGRDEEPSADTREAFSARIAARLGLDHPQAELVARAVLRCIRDALGEQLARDVESQLPEDLAQLWRLDQTRLTDVQGDEKPRRVAERAARGERHG